MRIKVNVKLRCPVNKMRVGTTNNPPVFTGEFEIEITPGTLERLLYGLVFVGGVWCSTRKDYSRKSNSISAEGYMINTDINYLRTLLQKGWKSHQGALNFYGIKLPER